MRRTSIATALFSAITVIYGCGGGGSPTSPVPSPVVVVECTLDTAQCILDRASVSVSVNNAFIDMSAPATVTSGMTFRIVVSFTNPSTQGLLAALRYVRDDGMERLGSCLGLSLNVSGGGGFNFSSTISATDAMFEPGHSVRIYVVGKLGPLPAQGDECPLRNATGGLNQDVAQGQRQLATFVVQ